MPRAASAIRYAQAIFQIAQESDDLDKWLEDLTLLADASSNQEFLDILDAPQVTVAQKTELISRTLSESVDQLPLNLISLLASKNIAHLLPDVTEQYQRLLDAHRGIERAEVVSAVSLDDEQRQKIVTLLEDLVGKEVRMTLRTDPQLIGGFIAQVGDRVIDGSTKTKIDTMRRNLA